MKDSRHEDLGKDLRCLVEYLCVRNLSLFVSRYTTKTVNDFTLDSCNLTR